MWLQVRNFEANVRPNARTKVKRILLKAVQWLIIITVEQSKRRALGVYGTVQANAIAY